MVLGSRALRISRSGTRCSATKRRSRSERCKMTVTLLYLVAFYSGWEVWLGIVSEGI